MNKQSRKKKVEMADAELISKNIGQYTDDRGTNEGQLL